MKLFWVDITLKDFTLAQEQNLVCYMNMQNPSNPTYLFNIYSPPCWPGSLQEAVSPSKGTPVMVVTTSPSTN